MSHALDFPLCVAGNYFIASARGGGGSRKGWKVRDRGIVGGEQGVDLYCPSGNLL